jgi:hypothetical protein
VLKVKITRDGEPWNGGSLTVAELGDIPAAMFAVSQYVGGGELIATVTEAPDPTLCGPAYKLTAEWLEGDA